MRALLTTILLFTTFHSFGQPDFRLDTSKKAIDSLFNRLSHLSKVIEKHGVDIAAPVGHLKRQIKSYRNDSTAISFYTDDDRLLFRIVNKCDRQNCRWREAVELYSLSGKLIYSERWNWSCLKASEKTDPEEKYFDALLYEKERFKYDSLGRLSEKVWWYAPIRGVRKYKYTYDNNNKQTYTSTKHKETLFWD